MFDPEKVNWNRLAELTMFAAMCIAWGMIIGGWLITKGVL